MYKLKSVSFAEQATQTIPAHIAASFAAGNPVTMKKAGKADRMAEDEDDYFKAINLGYTGPDAPQNSGPVAGRVSRSRTNVARAAALKTSRDAQSNSLRMPDWANIGESYDCTVIGFQNVYEVVNGVQSEIPKFAQCKLETIENGEKVAFSILFTEKLPDVGQECTVKCVEPSPEQAARVQSGKVWEVQ